MHLPTPGRYAVTFTHTFGSGINWGALQRMRDELDKYTYKPGWDLEILTPAYSGYETGILAIEYTADDSREEGRKIRVGSKHTIPEYIADLLPDHPDQFGHWLAEMILAVERHEAQEWLRYQGEIVDDPHLTDGRTRTP